MKLRFAADRRTLVWAFVFFPAVEIAQYVWPGVIGWFLPLSLYVGFCAGVFAHNQNHCPTFEGRQANHLFATWISVFYGYPTFAWIPTHNVSHHKYVNRPGDAQITWRYSKKNTWLVASSYFFVSSYWQGPEIREFVASAKSSRPGTYRQIVAQRAAVVGAQVCFLALAIAWHGWKVGSLVYASSFGATAAMGLWGMMFINFIQHVHCDPWSAHDHSRNFVGKLGNFFVFNNGLHAAHHENPGAHWSTLPELHAAIANEIHPDLCQASIFGYCLKTYLLGMYGARFRTKQIGRAAYQDRDTAAPPSVPALLRSSP